MASLSEYVRLYIEWIIQLFHRFIWGASDITDVSNKAVFITGCDTGFGHLTALTLNESGFHVFAGCLFSDRDGARGLLIKAKFPTKMTIVQIDVTNDLSVRLAYEQVSKSISDQNLHLHSLINNAGICPYFEVEWGSIDLIRKVLEVNTIGVVLVTKTFLPLIRASEGRIVNVNSVAARYSVPGLVPYCMSKSASLSFTEGLRREVTKFNVKVISIEPAFYATRMVDIESVNKQMETVWREADPGVKESYGDHYFKRTRKQNWLITRVVNRNNAQVSETIRHAVMNNSPQYHYIVADTLIRWFLTIGMYTSPQESIELAFKAFALYCAKDRPLPGSYDDKKMT